MGGSSLGRESDGWLDGIVRGHPIFTHALGMKYTIWINVRGILF